MDWKIFYGDGSIFDSLMGSPSEAPSFNVQVIVCKNETNGRSLYHTWDWYYWNGEEWRGADIHGLLDQLLHDTENKICGIKQGRTVKDEVYEELLLKAINDKDFKPRAYINKLEKPKERIGVVE